MRGNTIRARHIGRDILAGLKNIVGGEIDDYTKMIAESREQAMDRMIANAEQLGANAVIGMRFMTCSMMQGAAEKAPREFDAIAQKYFEVMSKSGE